VTGESVPLLLIPRYTGLVGAQTFATVPLEVSDFMTGWATVWRGPLVGTSPNFMAFFEVSQDAVHWNLMGAMDPGANNAERVGLPLLSRRWLRARIVLTGSGDVGVTCWCSGSLNLRVS
jgi:hypothetical protein